MKKLNALLTAVLIASALTNGYTQTIIDFESLTVPESGFYNGSTDHSGTIGSTETFSYNENGANFYVTYTLEEFYDYWTGFAYSNQTDLETADWTNYSAYANPPGGATDSENYIFAFILNDTYDSVMFDNSVLINSIDISNTVWAYQYMTGLDGTGNTYMQGDSLVLTVKGIQYDGNLSPDSVSIYLGLNTTILDNWQTFNFTSLGEVIGIKCSISSSDIWTPYYFCMDNIVTTESDDIQTENRMQFSIYPNPSSEYIIVNGIMNASVKIIDLNGNIRMVLNNVSDNSRIDVSCVKPGLYMITALENGKQSTKTFVII